MVVFLGCVYFLDSDSFCPGGTFRSNGDRITGFI